MFCTDARAAIRYAELEPLADAGDEDAADELGDIAEKLEEENEGRAKARAAQILAGLQVNPDSVEGMPQRC